MRASLKNYRDGVKQLSETIKCTSVLILDNCDDILVSTSRHEFLSFIDSLVMKSNFKLHIIIVSRERLLYLDSFDCWTVRELNQSASIQLLDKLAPAIDNESLTEVAELVEGCPLALKVVGQLLHIHGIQLIQKMKKELINILDRVSVYEQRFRVLMDIAFNRLGVLRDCGYVLSLFPGSFDESAGNTIVQEECLEIYLKHSLLNDYSLAFNYRYKMHRLIKDYLKEKVSIGEKRAFIKRFRKHFETLLLTLAKKQEIDDTEKYILSLEVHNLYYLRELLLIDMHSSPEELAVLAFLFDTGLMQLKQLHTHYTLYIKKVREVCLLLYPKLCGKVYTNIVRHLYQKCKCETLMAYVQNFFISSCMEHFQCEVVDYLQVLYTSGVLQLSDNESSYIDLVVGLHCTRHYLTRHFDSVYWFSFVVSKLSLRFFGFNGNHVMFTSIIFYGSCELALQFYEFDIKIAPQLRILEIVSKLLCQYACMFTAIGLMYIIARRLSLRNCIIATGTISVIYCSVVVCYTHMHMYVYSMPQYCCQVIPVCV